MKTMHGNPNRAGFSPWRMLVLCLLALVVAVSAAPGAKAQADIFDLDNMTFGWAFGLDSWQVTFTATTATIGTFDVEFSSASIATGVGFDVTSADFSATFTNGAGDELCVYVGTSGMDFFAAPSTSEYVLAFLMEGDDGFVGRGTTPARDEVYGGGGSDTIDSLEGDDVIWGDDWYWLTPTPGADVIDAGDDDDAVTGGPGNDLIYGGMGLDVLYGEEDDDDLYGDTGTRTTGDRDIIYGGLGDDYISGDGGDDDLYGFWPNAWGFETDWNVINGGDGDDLIEGSNGLDILHGGADEDDIYGFGHNDGISGDGWAYPSGGGWNTGLDAGANDDIFGGIGNDNIHGNGGDDDIFGGDGTDWIWGGDGEDYVEGGANDDFIRGEDDDDELHGNDGDDAIDGGEGRDDLFGEDGTNFLHDDDGDPGDTLTSGAGNGGVGIADNLVFCIDLDSDTVTRSSGSGNRLWVDITGNTDSIGGPGTTTSSSDDPSTLPGSSAYTSPQAGYSPFEWYTWQVFYTNTWAGPQV